MSYGAWSLVIFLTFAVGMLGIAWWTGRDDCELRRIAAPGAAGPQHLSTALNDGTAASPTSQPTHYGPFPVDTGPLLLLSEKAAALVAHEQEIHGLIVEAESKIPARWR